MASDLEVFLQALVQPAQTNLQTSAIILAATSDELLQLDTDTVTTSGTAPSTWGIFNWGAGIWGR